MVCTLDPGFMPEDMRAGGKGVLGQAPPPHRGLCIWQAMTWQATLDLGAIDSTARGSAPHPCARIWTCTPRYVILLLCYMQAILTNRGYIWHFKQQDCLETANC
jgi:hypothetical protein